MHYLKAFLKEDEAYFANATEAIMEQNGHMLVDGCLLYSLVLVFYTVLSVTTPQPALLRNLYFIYDGIHLLLCAAVFTRPARLKASPSATQLFCVALELSILSFFALEGAITTPTQHSLYVPIAILLIQLLFIHRAAYSTLLIFLYTALFSALSFLHKAPEAARNDFYIAVATFLSANIGYMLIAKLRRNEQLALAKLENLSRIDVLTGLYNKSTLDELCQNCIGKSGPCTLLVVDLDDFKKINDEHGHDVGDEVLKNVGAAFRRVFRNDDIVGRFGGDEFVALMNGCDDPDVVRERMRAFQRRVDEMRFSVPGLKVFYSAGIAFKQRNDDFRSMFARADRALYAAKREGKNRLSIGK